MDYDIYFTFASYAGVNGTDLVQVLHADPMHLAQSLWPSGGP